MDSAFFHCEVTLAHVVPFARKEHSEGVGWQGFLRRHHVQRSIRVRSGNQHLKFDTIGLIQLCHFC